MLKKFLKDWKKTGIVLFFILLFAFAIRIYNLTILPVFADEAIYIRWSQVMSAEPTLRFLPLSDGKQPLFMWILMFLVRRFPDPLFIGRFISVVCGLGTIVGIFGSTIFLFRSKKAALVAALIWALSPFSFFFDRMALVDSLLAMFGVWIFFFGVLTVKSGRLDWAMVTSFGLGGALLTKSPAIFFVVLIPTLVLVAKLGKGKKDRLIALLKLVGLGIVTYVIGWGMYNILRLGPNFQLIGQRNLDYVFPYTHILTDPLDPFISYIKEIFGDWLIKMGPGIVLLLGLGGVLLNVKKYPRQIVLLLIWFFVPVLVQAMYAKVFTARYILFSLPYLFILASSLVFIKKGLYQRLAVFGFITFVIWATWNDCLLVTKPEIANLPSSERSGYLEEWTAGTGIKEVAGYIKTQHNLNPNQQIVVGTEGYFGTLPDGLQMYLDGIPKIVVVGVGLNLEAVPSSLAESRRAGNPTYLVINKSRLKIANPAKLGLKLIALYPKAMRGEKQSTQYLTYGPQEVLYLFEVTGKAL